MCFNLELEGFICHWFPYVQLMERFKLKEKRCEKGKTEFDVVLYTNVDHIIAKWNQRMNKLKTV